MTKNKAVEKGYNYLELTDIVYCIPQNKCKRIWGFIKKALQITAKAKEDEINGTLVKKARVIYGDLVQDNINKEEQIKQLQKDIHSKEVIETSFIQSIRKWQQLFKIFNVNTLDKVLEKATQLQKENEELKEHINNDIQCIRCSTVKALRITIENLKQEHGVKDK